MNDFDTITDSEGKEYLVLDKPELFDDSQMGNKSDDFEILRKLGGEGSFGKVYKVRSKINNKVYAMKMLDIEELKEKNQSKYQFLLHEIKYLETLVHPHIIKYYKHFIEGKYLCIITEFAPNGDIKGYIEAHKVMNKHIPEEKLWNIFLQCLHTLDYIHSIGIIHRNIKPTNLFLDNNMIVKLGFFCILASKNKNENMDCDAKRYDVKGYEGKGYEAKEVFDEKEEQKIDIYSMGVSFFEMCYFHVPYTNFLDNENKKNDDNKKENPENKNVHYSKEILNIIDLMIEEDKKKRKTSKEILDLIHKEYFKECCKNSSIDSIVRCLHSFTPLTQYFLSIPSAQRVNKPITNAFAGCFDSFCKLNLIDWHISIGYLRQVVCSENNKLEMTKEIEPRLLFVFLLKELHKELKKPLLNSNKHLMISGGKVSIINKMGFMSNLDALSSKYSSAISKSFSGLMITTNYCEKCKFKTYSPNKFYFVTFDLENIAKNNKFYELNLKEQFINQKNITTKKILFCSRCKSETKHISIKDYNSFPEFLVISIQRGINYKCKNPICIEQKLDLTGIVGLESKKQLFNLVSLIGRKIDEGNEIFFSIINFANNWFYCEGNNIHKIDFSSKFNSYGDILMIFYM